jgi:hypothetical protein
MSMDIENFLTDEEVERLDLLVEEASEVIQIAQKIKRFGFESNFKDGKSNRVLLEGEIGDFQAIVGLMMQRGEVDGGNIEVASFSKLGRMKPFTRHQDAVIEEVLNVA